METRSYFREKNLIEKFSWKNVQTSAAVFNPDKLLWLNAEYLKTSPPDQVAQILVPLLEQAGLTNEVRAVSIEWLAQLVVLVKERTKTLIEMVHWVRPYFGETVVFEEEAAKKFLTASPGAAIDQAGGNDLRRFPRSQNRSGKRLLKSWSKKRGSKWGNWPSRYEWPSLVGRRALDYSK